MMTRLHAVSLQRSAKRVATPRVHIDVSGLPKSVTWSRWLALQRCFDASNINYDLRINGVRVDGEGMPSCRRHALVAKASFLVDAAAGTDHTLLVDRLGKAQAVAKVKSDLAQDCQEILREPVPVQTEGR